MKKHSLKSSLYRVFSISVLMPCMVISLIMFCFFNIQLLNSYKTNNRIILQTVINHLDSSLEETGRFFMQYLVDTNISDFYNYVNRYVIDASEENLNHYIRNSAEYRVSLNNYLTISDSNHKGIGFFPEKANKNNLFFLQKYRGFIIRYDKEETAMKDLRSQLSGVPLGKELFLSGSLMNGCEDYQEEDTVFTIVRPVNHLESAKRQGYVFLEISRKLFSDLSREVTLPKGAGLVIYFPDGTPAYATEEKFIDRENWGDKEMEQMGKRVHIEKKTYYLYGMGEKKYGFTVHYLLPRSTILREANRTNFMILLLWFGAMLIAFFIYTSLSCRISASTEKIMSYIQKYRLGDSEEDIEQVPAMSIEEFDDISLALREMTGRITDLLQKEYIWKMDQRMAEYKAMQAEINPHFFNNVMNSLQALNRMGDTKSLEKGIVNLSRMFRYTCGHGYDSNIQQECRFIESYLMLEKMRFEERISYEIQAEKGILEFPIPKLLLQPLIENAICHGMSQEGEPLRIELKVLEVKAKNGMAFVWITVANDGIPYREKEIWSSNRVGISNVRNRLFITYPDSFLWYDRKGRFRTVCNLLIAKDRPASFLESEMKR